MQPLAIPDDMAAMAQEPPPEPKPESIPLLHARLQVHVYQRPHNVLGHKGRAKGKVLRKRGYRYDKDLSRLVNGGGAGIKVRSVEELKGILKGVGERLVEEMGRVEADG